MAQDQQDRGSIGPDGNVLGVTRPGHRTGTRMDTARVADLSRELGQCSAALGDCIASAERLHLDRRSVPAFKGDEIIGQILKAVHALLAAFKEGKGKLDLLASKVAEAAHTQGNADDENADTFRSTNPDDGTIRFQPWAGHGDLTTSGFDGGTPNGGFSLQPPVPTPVVEPDGGTSYVSYRSSWQEPGGGQYDLQLTGTFPADDETAPDPWQWHPSLGDDVRPSPEHPGPAVAVRAGSGDDADQGRIRDRITPPTQPFRTAMTPIFDAIAQRVAEIEDRSA